MQLLCVFQASTSGAQDTKEDSKRATSGTESLHDTAPDSSTAPDTQHLSSKQKQDEGQDLQKRTKVTEPRD